MYKILRNHSVLQAMPLEIQFYGTDNLGKMYDLLKIKYIRIVNL
jgi:hypothetical protein